MIPFNNESSFDVLLHQLFDYAGMFPPASLSFEDATAESATLPVALQRPWLLGGDLVLDVAHARQLHSIQPAMSRFSRPIRLCLLATEPVRDVCALADSLVVSKSAEDVQIIITSLEVKVALGSAREIASSLDAVTRRHNSLLAIEPDLSTPEWEDALKEVVDVAASERGRIALKCRCTGPTGLGANRLAKALVSACDALIPFKVTGGFHHPIAEPTHHAYQMGFLNLAAAVVLRTACPTDASEERLVSLLLNDSAGAFSFHGGLSVLGFSVPHAHVVSAKQAIRFSIGSCSLREPDDDLLRLFPTGR